MALFDCTKNERESLESGYCPDCNRRKFLTGPKAGLCVNIKCDHCGAEFNIGPLTAERIMPEFVAPAPQPRAEVGLEQRTQAPLPEPKYEQSDWDYAAAVGKQRPYKNESSMKCELAIAWAGVHMRQRQLLDALRAVKAANGVIEAARGIRHWHDAMKDNSGMVVSAEHVHKLWTAIAAYDALAGNNIIAS